MDLNIMVAIRETDMLPTGYHKAILYAIASRGEKAYPNQSQLMRDSGIGSRNTLIKIVKELEDLGWLKITKSRHGNNKYWNNRYQVVVPDLLYSLVNIDDMVVKTDTLKINKDKVKIQTITKNKESREGWNHSTLSELLLPVSGINKGESNER